MNEREVVQIAFRALDIMNAQAVKEFRVPPNTYTGGGARVEDFEALADAAIQDYCLTTNPRTVSQKQIVKVYQHTLQK